MIWGYRHFRKHQYGECRHHQEVTCTVFGDPPGGQCPSLVLILLILVLAGLIISMTRVSFLFESRKRWAVKFTQAGLGSHPIFASLQILVKTTCFAHCHGMFKSYHSENPPCRKKPKKPPNLGKVSMSLNTSGFTLKFKALKKKFWWDTAKLLAEMNASHTVPKWCLSHPCKKI